jgi:hypothetical protein
VAFDLRFIAEYHSAARTYTELSDLLGELTYQQDYARLGGQVGLVIHGGKYFKGGVNFTLEHDTDHWLTDEDLGGPGASGQINITTHVGQNPNFDFRYDNPGSRFLLQDSVVGTLSVNLMAMF